MKKDVKKILFSAITVLFLVGVGVIVVQFYPYLFSKEVVGTILKVERVNQNEAFIANGAPIPANQLFSFAVSIKDSTGEIHTASTEDRQWAVAQTGQCVEAKFYPYPPWALDKYGTYHGARLIRLYECDKK